MTKRANESKDIDTIIKAVEDYKHDNTTMSAVARKYNISNTSVKNWVRKDQNNELFEFLLKVESSQEETDETDKIFEYEDKFNPFKVNRKINLFYSDELKIGDNINLDEETTRNELKKLRSLINSYDFKRTYGRNFDIVDLYLTTNLSIKTICIDSEELIGTVESKLLLYFLQGQVMKVDNNDIFINFRSSRSNTYIRYTRPAEKRIYDLLNQKFLLYNKPEDVTYTKEDIYMAFQYLHDLNLNYGVKYDEISFYTILITYKKGLINTYYEVAEKYKNELDEHTHVHVRENPILTRRENN